MRIVLIVGLAMLALPACVEPAFVPPTQTNVTVQANLVSASGSQPAPAPLHAWGESGGSGGSYGSSGSYESASRGSSDGVQLVSASPVVSSAAANVLVLQSTHIDRPTEVIGIVDVHAPSGSDEDALAVLRSRAAAMGADAVLGVEFHHGEEHEGSTHLSGLGVRFISLSSSSY